MKDTGSLTRFLTKGSERYTVLPRFVIGKGVWIGYNVHLYIDKIDDVYVTNSVTGFTHLSRVLSKTVYLSLPTIK